MGGLWALDLEKQHPGSHRIGVEEAEVGGLDLACVESLRAAKGPAGDFKLGMFQLTDVLFFIRNSQLGR